MDSEPTNGKLFCVNQQHASIHQPTQHTQTHNNVPSLGLKQQHEELCSNTPRGQDKKKGHKGRKNWRQSEREGDKKEGIERGKKGSLNRLCEIQHTLQGDHSPDTMKFPDNSLTFP